MSFKHLEYIESVLNKTHISEIFSKYNPESIIFDRCLFTKDMFNELVKQLENCNHGFISGENEFKIIFCDMRIPLEYKTLLDNIVSYKIKYENCVFWCSEGK